MRRYKPQTLEARLVYWSRKNRPRNGGHFWRAAKRYAELKSEKEEKQEVAA